MLGDRIAITDAAGRFAFHGLSPQAEEYLLLCLTGERVARASAKMGQDDVHLQLGR